MEEGVHSSMADNIMTITINRPESRNSLDMVAVRACAPPLFPPAGWGGPAGWWGWGAGLSDRAGLSARRLFSS